MNRLEQEDARRLAPVIRAARKLRGLSQSDVSKSLEVSQRTFSNIEKGKAAISGSLWFRLAQILDLSAQHCFTEGIIDNTDHLTDPAATDLVIPKVYTHNAHSTIRTSQPFFNFFVSRCGEKTLNEFLSEHVGIDPDIRYIYNLRLSVRFNCDLAAFLIQKGHLRIDNLSEVTSALALPRTHGRLAMEYARAKNRMELIHTLFDKIALYEKNFSYTIIDQGSNSIDIESKPAQFMRYFSYKEDQLPDFINLYRASFLESFSTFLSPHIKTTRVKVIPGGTKRKTECVFRVQV